nr:germin-like protein subfamily 1 member 6 [Quercus suber]
MMKVVIVAILALATTLVSAYDPSPLQDFCVAINHTDSAVFVNGKFCKDPATVTANDFSSLDSIFLETQLQINLDQVSIFQNPGLITIANAVFGSNPPINPDVLIKAFQLDKSAVDYLQKQF